ncbi:MAG: C40 family peptidase [Actinobacteria bacterium]|nr:C40 family peptidase [Actinomycetota bacterium]
MTPRTLFVRSATASLVAFVALGVSAAPASAAPAAIKAKEAQVQDVLGQIQQLDANLEQAIEAYNAATDRLHAIEDDLRVNTRELHIARVNLKRSQAALANRLVSIYTGEAAPSTLGILLGAGSMDEMLSQIETSDRVSSQDAAINRQVLRFRAAVKKHRVELKNAEAEQQQLVQERADAQASIESQLSDRRQLVDSIRSEIQQMKAEERRRQAELRRQAAEARAAQAAQIQQVALGNPYATSPQPTVNVPPSSVGSTVVNIAMRYLGIPYVYAAADPSVGFDCSGLIMYVFNQVGISLPHYAASIYGYGVPVSQDQLQPGDLVFFHDLGHMGMYIGGGNFIHAPHTGDVVKISSLSDAWYASTYVGARRIAG